ncbi:MAG TPA: GyrI-like domain-containing protein [Candidatus Dormibacteraeota bacterium]|nr:GyrI-like domain-containing protein [Candidatus Dormibacteraeota bacterium]
MPVQDSRSEYTARMHRVLEFIDRHLDQPLELDALASVANFSAYHFHRLFTAWMGETLGEFVRRRRLEVAAQRLAAQPRLAVTEVALGVGFGSTEAFSRAFKSRFGATPTAWRRSQVSNRDQVLSNHDQAVGASRRNDGVMKVTIVDRQPATIAYLRHVGPYGKPVSDFWMNDVAPWMETNGLFGKPRYGISHDDPDVTAPEKLRYDAAVEVGPDFVGSGKHQKTVLPGGRYAVGKFEGNDRDVGEAWAWLIRDWLPDSGMQLDSRPFFEHYPVGSTYDEASGRFECEICIPVMPL